MFGKGEEDGAEDGWGLGDYIDAWQCQWDDCVEILDVDRAETFIEHVRRQEDGICMWRGCDFASQQRPITHAWLEMHGWCHSGYKPHACTVSGCACSDYSVPIQGISRSKAARCATPGSRN